MSLPWSSKGVKATPVNADEVLIIDSADANPATQNKRITLGSIPINSPLTTKGDVYTFDSADQRLPVGADGQILTADSAELTGIKWAAAPLTGITSINADTTAAQILASGTGLSILDAGDTHTFSIDGTVVTLTGVQTLTNKTIDGDDNTIIDINETQMNVSVGASGTVLTSNGVGLAPTYQVIPSGEFFGPWTANHDAGGFNLTNLAVLESNAATPADDGVIRLGTGESILWRNGGDSDNVGFEADDLELSFIGWTSLVINEAAFGADWGNADFTGIENFDMSGAGIMDLADSELLSPSKIVFSASSQEQAISLGNVEVISWEKQAGTGYAGVSSNASDEFVIGFSAASPGALVSEYTFTETTANFLGNNLTMGAAYIDLAEITTPAAPAAATGRVYTKDVSGATHLFIQDDTTETDLNLGGSITPWTSNIDADGFALLDSGYIEVGSALATPFADAGEIRMPEQAGIFWRNNADNGNVGLTSDDITLVTNGFTDLDFNSVSGDVDLSSCTFVDLGSANVEVDTLAVFTELEMGGSAPILGGTFIELDNTNGNPIADDGAVRLSEDAEIAWRNTGDSDNLLLYASADDLNFEGFVNEVHDATGTIDYSSANELDAGSALGRLDTLELGSYIFTTGTFASVGRIRMENLDILAWRNFAGTGDITLQVNASDQFAFNSVLTVGNNVIKAVDTPVDGTDAANKTYVDNLVNGLSWKNPAVVATTGDIGLSGNQTIDGVLTVNDDRVLVKDQTDGSENGVYASNTGAWTRTTDTDSESDLLNMSIYISQGSTQADTSWVLTTDAPIVVDTTVLNYAQVGAGTGNPLTTKGDVFGYDTANARIPVGADGQVLTANSAVALGVDYQSKEFVGPWTANHDAGGFNLTNLAILESNATNPALIGAIRLGSTEGIGWRNAANSDDESLSLNASDQFVFTAPLLINDIPVFADGLKVTFNPDATNAGVNVGSQADPDPTVPVNGDIYYNSTNDKFRAYENSVWVDMIGGGSGDVVGPGSSTDEAVARFDGITGKLLQNTSALTISDTGLITFPDGVRQIFNPDATNSGINVGAQGDPDPTSPVNGDIYYNSTNDKFRAYENSVWVDMIGGASPLTTKGDIFTYDTGDARLPVGTNGQVLTANSAVALGVEWAAAGAGSQTPWTSDIAAATFNLSNFGVLSFDAPATSDPGQSDSISMQTGAFNPDMIFHVNANNSAYQFFIGSAGTAQYTFKNNTLDMGGAGLTNPGNFLDTNNNELLTWVTTASAVNFFTIENAATGNAPVLRAGAFGDASVDISIQGRSKGDIIFGNQVGQETLRLLQNAGSGQNNVTIENAITSAGPIISTEGSDTNVDLNFDTKGTGEINFLSLVDLGSNILQNAVLTSGITVNDAITWNEFRQTFNPNATIAGLNVGSQGDPDPTSPVNGDIYYNSTNDKFRAYENSVWVDMVGGGSGDVVGPASSVDNTLVTFDGVTGKLIQGAGTTGFEVTVDSAGQPTWPRAILFTNTTTQPAASLTWIESFFSDLQLNASTGNTVQMSINAGIEYVFDATNLNFNRNNADQLGAVIFNTAGALTAPLITDPYIEWDVALTPDAMVLNVPSGTEHILSYNGVEEYTFSASIFTGNGNILRNWSALEIKSITGSGTVIIENTDTTPTAADSVGTLRFRADRTASSSTDYAELQTVVVDPAAASADGELILKVIQANTLTEYITLNEGASTGIHFKRPVQDFQMDLTTGTAEITQIEGLRFNDDSTQLAGLSYIQRSNLHLVLNSPTGEDIELGINDLPELTIALNQLTINPGTDLLAGGDVVVSDRLQGQKGPDVASADAITLGDGNYFDISGSGTINHMINTNWQSGSVVILQFDAGATVTDAAGGATGAEQDFALAGAANFVATSGDTLTLVNDGTLWRETGRSVN